MLPPELHLEVRSRLPARRNGRPPLLFVHGGYCDAWCWEPYFLPFFAEKGYAAHALSLRGHGESGGYESLFVAGLDDFVADVERVASTLPSPPILIGHSMGASIVERLMLTRPVRGAALRPMYFSRNVAPTIVDEAQRHFTLESARALLDMTLRLQEGKPVAGARPLVLGVGDDRIATPRDVRATASVYGVQAIIVPGLAHMMMLDDDWSQVAQPLLDWLATLKT
jgi:pimeloyl-ACP methyl ester carboxylesterase